MEVISQLKKSNYPLVLYFAKIIWEKVTRSSGWNNDRENILLISAPTSYLPQSIFEHQGYHPLQLGSQQLYGTIWNERKKWCFKDTANSHTWEDISARWLELGRSHNQLFKDYNAAHIQLSIFMLSVIITTSVMLWALQP